MLSKVIIKRIPKPTLMIVIPTAFYTLAFFAIFVFAQHRHDPFWFRLGFFSNYVSAALALWVLLEKKTGSNKSFRFFANCTTLVLFLINCVLFWGTWHELRKDAQPIWILALAALFFSLISEFRREKVRSGPSGDSLIVLLE